MKNIEHIPETKQKLFEQWCKDHDCRITHLGYKQNQDKIQIHVSHSSGIGVTVKAECKCGRKIDLTDFSTW